MIMIMFMKIIFYEVVILIYMLVNLIMMTMMMLFMDIQLLEYRISARPRHKNRQVPISETKSGIIDPLVPKRHF